MCAAHFPLSEEQNIPPWNDGSACFKAMEEYFEGTFTGSSPRNWGRNTADAFHIAHLGKVSRWDLAEGRFPVAHSTFYESSHHALAVTPYGDTAIINHVTTIGRGIGSAMAVVQQHHRRSGHPTTGKVPKIRHPGSHFMLEIGRFEPRNRGNPTGRSLKPERARCSSKEE